MPLELPDAGAVASSALEVAHPWVRRLMRLGFIARGVLYASIGVLTLWSLWRNGQHAHGGMKTTLESMHSMGPGVVLLAGLALGFAGFALGMMWTAIFNWNFEEKSTLGYLRRLGSFINGLVHIGLTVSVALLLDGHKSESHAPRRWTELAMSYSFGREGVAIGGLYAIGFGIFLWSQMWTGRFDPRLDLSKLPPARSRLFSALGRFGMFARGILYITIGVVLARAGWREDASDVVGLGGAMHRVSENPYGAATLGLVAAGLIAYGLFMFVEARYRKIGEHGR